LSLASTEINDKSESTIHVLSLASTERVKTGWLRIRIMCPSGATCLSVDCYLSALAL
jgi:hypothetical protein